MRNAAAADRATAAVWLSANFQPLVNGGTDLPFAWRADVTVDGIAFEAILGGLGHDIRQAIDGERAALSVREAVAKGILRTEALLIVPVNAACGSPDVTLARLLRAAARHGVPAERLVVEICADERGDLEAAERLAEACALDGLRVSLGAFAAGHVGLNLLARFKPLFVALDAALVRNVEGSGSRCSMVEGTLRLARSTGTIVIAPAVETQAALDTLRRLGVAHFRRGPALRPLPSAVAPRRAPRTLPVGTRRDLATHRRPPAPPQQQPVAPGTFASLESLICA